MLRTLFASLALAAAVPVAAQAPQLTSLTEEFDAFATGTVAMPEAERAKAFRKKFNALLPGFYEPRYGASEAQYDARVARALAAYPGQRDKILAASRAFTGAYETATARFRTFFPDYKPVMPIYITHSLGEMDGGTRELHGRVVAIFGVDVIARIHDAASIGPFLDHELFHFYHNGFFEECEPVWCSLWTEGLATYVASKMNPGADDKGLMLTIPRPIRPEVEPRMTEAMCLVRGKLDSEQRDDYAMLFLARETEGAAFPPRFGYFLGYTLVARIGENRSLEKLAKMSAAEVKPLLLAELARYDCPRG